MPDEFGFFFFPSETGSRLVNEFNSDVFSSQQAKQIIKKNVRHPEKKTKWRSIGKGTPTVIIFLFGMQNDFLRVALSSYEANVTFLFHFGCIEANASSCESGLAV